MRGIFLLSALIALLNSKGFCTQLTDLNSTLTAYTLDDELVRKLNHEVDLLNSSNDVLRLRLEMITARLDQQTEILNKFSTILASTVNCEKAVNNLDPLIDIRGGYEDDKPKSCNCVNEKPQKYPNSCAEATSVTKKGGLYTIQLELSFPKPFLVSCDVTTQGGGWTVIQRRLDGSVDFYRNWADYKVGFGNLAGEFFIGLDKLHALTTATPQELLIVMSDFEDVTKFAKYDSFAIGDESEDYALKVLGAYSGDANDSLTYHMSQKFTTHDKKNDIHSNNCAVQFKGAWWYKNCHESNLNGHYLKGEYSKDKFAQGVVWREWRGHYYSLKTVNMLIRPKSN